MSTQNQCAARLEISNQRFRFLQNQGILPRAAPGELDEWECARAYMKWLRGIATGRGEGSNQRQRLEKIRADQAELEYRVRTGELVEVDDILQEWVKLTLELKSKLRAIAIKAAPLVIGHTKLPKVQHILQRQIDAALKGFSEAGTRGKRSGKAPARSDHKRVGRKVPKAKPRK